MNPFLLLGKLCSQIKMSYMMMWKSWCWNRTYFAAAFYLSHPLNLCSFGDNCKKGRFLGDNGNEDDDAFWGIFAAIRWRWELIAWLGCCWPMVAILRKVPLWVASFIVNTQACPSSHYFFLDFVSLTPLAPEIWNAFAVDSHNNPSFGLLEFFAPPSSISSSDEQKIESPLS